MPFGHGAAAYVSLGDSTITGYGLSGYEDGVKNGWLQTVSGVAHTLLAKELFGDNWKNQFLNYCQGSLRADDLLLILQFYTGAIDKFPIEN